MSVNAYKEKLRIRSCGILFEKDKILLIQLHSPVNNKLIWIPPGGGVDFGESLQESLKREFQEETGLKVSVGKLLFINQLIDSAFHAIEFYFQVQKMGGKFALGKDPEHLNEGQILKDLKFFSEEEIQKIDVVPAYLQKEVWAVKRKGFKDIDIFAGSDMNR